MKNIVTANGKNYIIRKLTPRECFRLMGVSDIDIQKIQQSGVSKTQQYKLAGNSIVVDVMAYIFGRLFSSRLSNKVEGKNFTPPYYVKNNYHKEKEYKPEEYLRVPQATAKGYVDVPPHSIFDGSYINSKTRRGRVQEGGRVSPTVTCSGEPLNVYEGVRRTKKNITD